MTTKATSETAPESQNFMDQFPRDIQPKSYGNWALGFDWVGLVEGRSGLAIYARHHIKEPVKAIVVRMKDAMAFAEKNRIPARAFGKFMAEAMSGEWDFDPEAGEINRAQFENEGKPVVRFVKEVHLFTRDGVAITDATAREHWDALDSDWTIGAYNEMVGRVME